MFPHTSKRKNMSLPVQKSKKNIQLILSGILYPLDSIKKTLKVFKIPSRRIKTTKKDTRIHFGIRELNKTLEFANYVLSLKR